MTHPATSPDSTFWVVQRGGLDGSTHGVLSRTSTFGAGPGTCAIVAAAATAIVAMAI